MDTQGQQAGHSKIKWGAIIAGAAILAGAVMFAPTFLPNIFTEIGETIKGLFTSSASPGVFTKIVDLFVSNPQIVGAGMMGGGIAYFMNNKGDDQSSAREDNSSFVANLELDRQNNLAMLRAANAGNPEAQRMLAQQMGRG